MVPDLTGFVLARPPIARPEVGPGWLRFPGARSASEQTQSGDCPDLPRSIILRSSPGRPAERTHLTRTKRTHENPPDLDRRARPVRAPARLVEGRRAVDRRARRLR